MAISYTIISQQMAYKITYYSCTCSCYCSRGKQWQI